MINEVGYSSQTKERLSEIDGWDNEVKAKLHNAIYKSIKDDYELFELHVAQVEQYVQSLISLKDINIIKSKVNIANSSRNLAKLPWKLVDASSKNRDECELFLLEGDSASGSLRKNRDHRYHAYLPMKGKSLNSVNVETSAVVNNDVLADIFNSVGSGVTGYNDISACRYGKIIIVSDSDRDGEHIQNLILGAFAVHASYLIEDGRVYICETPLYKQGGKYFYPSDKKDPDFSKPLDRFKGIAALSNEDVKYSILDKDTRRLTRVTTEMMDEAVKLIGSPELKKKLMIERKVLR